MQDSDKIPLILILIISLIFIAFMIFLLLFTAIIVQVIASIFFGLATLIAAFQNEIRHLWKRPKMEIICEGGSPFIIQNNAMTYFRIKIKNIGNEKAINCFVRLNQIIKISDCHKIVDDPINLKWSGAPSDERGNFKEYVDIPQKGGYTFLDLLHMQNNLFRKQNLEQEIADITNHFILTSPGSKGEQRNLNLLFEKQGYVCSLTFYSDNLDPENYLIAVYISQDRTLKIEDITNNSIFKKLKGRFK